MRVVRYVTVIVVLLLIAACGARNQQPQEPITVDTAWVRPALASGNSAAYMSITNHTNQPITLTTVTADFAGMVQIHQTVVENDMAHMQHLDNGMRIGAGETLSLQPGGYHVMLMSVQQSLNEGETVSIGLIFDNGETVTVEAEIRNGTAELE
jgi:periplasmic copper chaperone A